VAAELAPTLPHSTPIAVACYLRELRPAIERLTEGRQAFIRRIGTLMEQVRQGDADGFAEEADHVGRDAASQFRFARGRLETLPVPGVCQACHEAVLSWIDMLVAAADVLAESGQSNDRSRLREVQSLLAESRMFSNRFRAQYEALVERLRQRGTAQPHPSKPRKVARLLRFGRRG
jgi:cell division septum initiation protein DivIVA